MTCPAYYTEVQGEVYFALYCSAVASIWPQKAWASAGLRVH